MIIIGLTGSIGMGKSTVSKMFRRLGVPVFDADAAVHHLQGAGGALVEAIETRFPGTTTALGVNRQRLGAAVLGKPGELAALEALVHPAIAKLRYEFLRCNKSRRLVVLDIPLLYERVGRQGVDLVVVVSAPAWVQRRRVMARQGMTMSKFKQIKRLQTPDHIKRRRADIIVETCRSLAQTQQQIRYLVACISARAGG